jgi:NADH-quinone oxidoreductase subunit G
MYAGLTLEELGGKGVRWPAREQAAAALPAPARQDFAPAPARECETAPEGRLAAGSYRSIWAAPEVAASPALAFLHPRQRVEISPQDADRLGLADGTAVLVADEHGGRIHAQVALHHDVPAGSAFLQDSLASDSAESLTGGAIEILPLPPAPPAPPELADGARGDSGPVEEAFA